MNDLEICKRLADIEGINYIETKYKGNANFIALVSENDFTGTPPEMIGKYDPLTDDALCFQLMVKYRLEVWEANGKWLVGFNLCNTVGDESPNKAICLAIIEAHKDS